MSPVPGGSTAAEATCPKASKVDVPGNQHSVHVVAPAGKLIAGYCVKAGSVQQGDGPEHYVVDPAVDAITISHSSGKVVSHCTLVLIDTPRPENPGDFTTPGPDGEPEDEFESFGPVPTVPETPGDVPTGTSPGGSLPSTGSNSAVPALLAGLLMAVGGAVVRVARPSA